MEMSNKTLAMLLVAAIAVSLFGTIFSLNRLESFGTTGFATQANGTASVYVNTTTSIIFNVSTINWGTGYVNTSGGYVNCTMATDAAHSAGCSGFTTVSNGFILENDGNTNATVSLYANATAVQFIGGSSGGGPLFQYKVSNNEATSCSSPAPSSYTDVNVTPPGTTICPSTTFDFNNSKDTMEIEVMINIPDNSLSGQRAATFTATASNP